MVIDGETLRAFPRPQALADAGVDGLRAIKFSRRKAEYITGISERIAAGELSLEAMRDMPDEEIVGALMALRGVGANGRRTGCSFAHSGDPTASRTATSRCSG